MELTPDRIKQINKLLWDEKYIIHNVIKGKGFCNINKNKRYNSWIFKGSGSKNLLKQFIAFNPEYNCIAQINDFNGFRQFIPFKSWQDCWNAYEHTGSRKRYLYEMIISDNPCKPYLDIEWANKDAASKNYTKFTHKLKKDLISIFADRYNIKLNANHILITECNRDNKTSFHVVINCIIDGKLYLFKTNRKKEQQSAWDLFNALIELDETYADKLDDSVYSLDREFRSIYSTKFGQYTAFKPVNDDNNKFCENYLDYFITHIDDKNTMKLIKTPKYVHKNTINNAKICDAKISLTKNQSKSTKLVSVCDVINANEHTNSNETINRIMELLQFIHPTSEFTGMTSDNNSFRFSYSDKTELCYTGHTHKNNGFCVSIKPGNKDIFMYCYSNKCGKLYKLGNVYINYFWKYEAICINQQFLDYKTEIKFTNTVEHEDFKFSGLINNFADGGGNYVIKSAMGTGKTQLLKNLIKHKFNDKRIIYLSHRQTFTHNIAGTLSELGFYNYLDGIRDITNKDKLIIQIDSLSHLIDIEYELRFFDIVIMDEIESLLNHLSSPTLSNKRTQICMILEQLIKNAKWVLSMDADFGNRGYDFLCKIKSKPRIIINNFRPVKKKFMFNKNYELITHQLLEDLKNKKNIGIICLSKNTLDDLHDKICLTIKDIKIIRYTSMTDDDQKMSLSHVNDEWTKYQCVLYSPSIEAGVDFNKEHFNKIYCFLSNGSCSPRSFLQMVGRIRTTTDNKIRCCYDKFMSYFDKNAKIPLLDDIEDNIVRKEHIYNNFVFTDVDQYKCKMRIKKDAFTKVFAYNYLENYEKQVNFMSILKTLLTEREYEYLNEDAGKIEEDSEIWTGNENTNDCVSKNITFGGTHDCANISAHDDTHDSTHMEPEINIEFNYQDGNSTAANSKKTIEMDELLDAPIPTKKEYDTMVDKKSRNLSTRSDKLAMKKYWYIQNFKIADKEFTMDFLINWYGKEHILKNILCAVGKMKIDDVNDQYLNNMKDKLKYLAQFIKVFGFKSVFDFTSVVEKDEKMENRMQNSKLLERVNYDKIMMCFGKLARGISNKFSINAFVILCNTILYEFGVTLKILTTRKMENGVRLYIKNYKLIEMRNGVKNLTT